MKLSSRRIAPPRVKAPVVEKINPEPEVEELPSVVLSGVQDVTFEDNDFEVETVSTLQVFTP